MTRRNPKTGRLESDVQFALRMYFQTGNIPFMSDSTRIGTLIKV